MDLTWRPCYVQRQKWSKVKPRSVVRLLGITLHLQLNNMKFLGVIALIFLQVILANADEHDHKVRVVSPLFCKSVNGLVT